MKNEATVKCAVANYFKRRGFDVNVTFDPQEGKPPCEGFQRAPDYIDIKCTRLQETWIIEAKGYPLSGSPDNIGTDFDTGLGQLITRMKSKNAFYGIAIPATAHFMNQCEKVSDYVRELLCLHWLLVWPDDTLRIIRPKEKLEGWPWPDPDKLRKR